MQNIYTYEKQSKIYSRCANANIPSWPCYSDGGEDAGQSTSSYIAEEMNQFAWQPRKHKNRISVQRYFKSTQKIQKNCVEISTHLLLLLLLLLLFLLLLLLLLLLPLLLLISKRCILIFDIHFFELMG